MCDASKKAQHVTSSRYLINLGQLTENADYFLDNNLGPITGKDMVCMSVYLYGPNLFPTPSVTADSFDAVAFALQMPDKRVRAHRDYYIPRTNGEPYCHNIHTYAYEPLRVHILLTIPV